ncbi:MAG: hypothetical protein EXR71_10075 [Myxococcales bacterium]|nr:hypothetical protein [Myxococcales bacterium]
MTERIQRYNVGRFGVALGVLAVTGVSALDQGPFANSDRAFFTILAVQLLLLIASALYTRLRRPGVGFLSLMFVVDVVGASLLSAFTGGGGSLLVFLYFPAIAAGAYLLGRAGAIAVSVLAAAGLLAVALFAGDAAGDDLLLRYWEVGFRVLSLLLVGILSGQLAESLERTGKALVAQKVASETVIERVRAGVLIAGLDDRIVEINPSGRLLLGNAIGRRVTEVFSGAVHHRSWEETPPDGRRLVCSQATLPDQGRVIVVEDVTELWAMRERAQRDERLVAAGHLSAGLAHEIRNPLAALSAILQLLREDRPSRHLDLALGETQRLNRLVEDFLTAAAAPALRKVMLELDGLVANIVDAFLQDPRFAGVVRVTLDLHPVRVTVDPDRLRQVLWNLLTNAAQSMPGGGEVRVGVEVAGRSACLRIADGGGGIAPEELSRIFDPFYTRRAGGTGLGLAVVEQLVRAHGGTVDVASPPGQGTTFTIHLPGVDSA